HEEKTYYVHQSLLTTASKYFQAALERDFIEAHEKKIQLPDVDTEIFDIFVDWLYSSKLEAIDTNLKETYIFADGHEVPVLGRTVLDATFRILNRPSMPTFRAIAYLYARLPAQSPYLRLVVD
ncbi:hypothetical protein K491DRAFT_549215, partial [Lophiostoma macrostomum CBS 122681]